MIISVTQVAFLFVGAVNDEEEEDEPVNLQVNCAFVWPVRTMKSCELDYMQLSGP